MKTEVPPPYKAEAYRIKPKDFFSKLDVAACYLHSAGKYLLLRRADTWSVPARKCEAQETPRKAVVREVQEETSIRLQEEHIRDIGVLYVRYPHVDFTYHIFAYECGERPPVHLSDEHHAYGWSSVEEALRLPLISGGREALHQFLALRTRPVFLQKEFYFMRHGETDVNADPHSKRVDDELPLNGKGVQQAMTAQRAASKLLIHSIRSSPIQRAVQTRDIMVESLRVPHQEDDDLTECKAAVWTKMVQLENGSGYDVCSSVQSYLFQVRKGIEAVFQEKGPTLVIAHGGIHWAICYHLGIEDHPWKIGNCEIVHFCPVDEKRWKASIVS